MSRAIACLVVVFNLAAGGSHAQEKLKLTINEAVKIAMQHNVSVIESENNYNATLANTRTKTWGNNLPTLDGNMLYNRSNVPNARFVNDSLKSSRDYYSASLDANYVLFNGMKNWEEQKQVKSDEKKSRLDLERTRQTVKLDVYRQYFDVLKRQQLLKVREENLKRANQNLKKVEEMNKIGSVPLSDVFKQKVQVGNDKLALVNAKNDLNISRATLNSLIGIDVNTETILEEVDVIVDVIEPDYDEQYQMASENRNDLKAAKQSMKSAKSGVTIARSGFYPTVSLFGSYSFSDLFRPTGFNDIKANDRFDVGVNVNIPIFNGFQTQSASVSAEQNLITAKSQFEATQRTVSLNVKTAILNLEAARENIKVTEETVVSAKEDLRLAQERYAIGAGTILDVITANASFVEAESNKIQAVYDYMLAKEELRLATGELDKQ